MIEIFHVRKEKILASYLKEKEAYKRIAYENKRTKQYNKMFGQIKGLETYIQKHPNNIIKRKKPKSIYSSEKFNLSEFVNLLEYPEHIKETWLDYCVRFGKEKKHIYIYLKVEKGQLF